MQLWRVMCIINSTNSLPWVCLGDFNKVLYQWEKVGRREGDNYKMVAFYEFLNDCLLMDLESKGGLIPR